jgi:hypothetical protein
MEGTSPTAPFPLPDIPPAAPFVVEAEWNPHTTELTLTFDRGMLDQSPASPIPGAITVLIGISTYQIVDGGVWGGIGPEPTVWTGLFTLIDEGASNPDSVSYDGSGGFNGSPDGTPCDPFTLPLPWP